MNTLQSRSPVINLTSTHIGKDNDKDVAKNAKPTNKENCEGFKSKGQLCISEAAPNVVIGDTGVIEKRDVHDLFKIQRWSVPYCLTKNWQCG
ncbi:hypothetical protein AC249_AIPGENE22277 [Exaiptasia diaphana]|nr:hypothetical protein AC249_AIPGENE22277 [Exaiptasia diaphana]